MIRALHGQGQSTRVELARDLGLSPATVTRIVTRLVEEGLLTEGASLKRAAVGRRPTVVALNGSAFNLVGIDISDNILTAALVTFGGEVTHLRSYRLPTSGKNKAVTVVERAVDELIQLAEGDELTVRGVGIGAPGTTDITTGHVLWAPALQWRDLPLRALIEKRCGLPTFVENNINLAAFGEYWFGAARGADPAVFFYLGEGIGAGLIVGGAIFRGAHNSAGEVGYILPSRAHLEGEHREVGAMESVASGAGLTALARIAATGTSAAGRSGSKKRVRVADVLSNADETPGTRALAAELIDYIAMTTVAIVSVLDPEIVVLGGDQAASPWLVDAVTERLERVAPTTPAVVLSALGAQAGVLGAAALALLEVEHLHLTTRGVVNA